MPQFHNGSDHPLSRAIGSGGTHAGEALLNTMLGTQQHKRMMSGITLVLFPVIAGQPLDPILQAAKPLVGAAVNQKISVPTTGTCILDMVGRDTWYSRARSATFFFSV